MYSYMFKLQSPSKYSLFDVIHLPRHFFHCSKQFLNSSILMPFSTSAVFCFISSTLAKRFHSKAFSIQVNKKCHSWWDWVNREGGTWGSCHFWSKTAEHSVRCGQVCSLVTHHEITNMLKESSKKIHWNRTQPLTTTPAGTLIQMAHLVGEACTPRDPPSRRKFLCVCARIPLIHALSLGTLEHH